MCLKNPSLLFSNPTKATKENLPDLIFNDCRGESNWLVAEIHILSWIVLPVLAASLIFKSTSVPSCGALQLLSFSTENLGVWIRPLHVMQFILQEPTLSSISSVIDSYGTIINNICWDLQNELLKLPWTVMKYDYHCLTPRLRSQ